VISAAFVLRLYLEFPAIAQPSVKKEVMAGDYEITTLSIQGKRFGIACGTDSQSQQDIVARQYAAGSLRHVRGLLSVMSTCVPPGGRILDLGAHVGGFSTAAAALGRRVLAVEASPRNCALLEITRQHNRLDTLHVEHAAVGDRAGQIGFQANGPWGQVVNTDAGGSVCVRMTTIDKLLDEHGWSGVDFVKLDVEGYEVQALRGASRLLEGADAPPVFFESNSVTLAAFRETPASLNAEFLRHGYTVYHVGTGFLVPVRDGEPQRKVCVDYLACKSVPTGLAAWRRPSLRSWAWRLKRSVRGLMNDS
jgi:FkbM family methyltransferase